MNFSSRLKKLVPLSSWFHSSKVLNYYCNLWCSFIFKTAVPENYLFCPFLYSTKAFMKATGFLNFLQVSPLHPGYPFLSNKEWILCKFSYRNSYKTFLSHIIKLCSLWSCFIQVAHSMPLSKLSLRRVHSMY